MSDRELLETIVKKITDMEEDLSFLKKAVSTLSQNESALKDIHVNQLVKDHDVDIRLIKKFLIK